MRRDDITGLKEQRAHAIADMQKMFTEAEQRSDNPGFTAEEQEKFDKIAAEERSLAGKIQIAEDLYKKEQEAKKALDEPLELRIADGDEVPESLAEWREKTRQTNPWDTPEYRSAWFHYMTAKSLAHLDIEESRVLSKATAGAGANLVPTSFYNQIINILRFTGPFQELASKITTDSGEALQIPSISSHGVAT